MTIGPRPKDRHYSYDEGTDEPSGLIDDEATDVERETPIDTEPVEQAEKDQGNTAPIFEE